MVENRRPGVRVTHYFHPQPPRATKMLSYQPRDAQRESYAAVRVHYHSNTKGKRKSVIIGGDNNKNVKVLPEDYATEAEARAAAQAEFARSAVRRRSLTRSPLVGRKLSRS